MGIYGRDYMQDRGGPGPAYARWTVTTKLIIANVVLWFVFAGSASWGGTKGGLFGLFWNELILHPFEVFGSLKLWQPFTAIWLHDFRSMSHVFWNMLFLFFFGRAVEVLLGRRGYLRLYLGAGVIAALALVPLAYLTGNPTPGLGASGAVYGIAALLALQRPHLPVYLFFVIRMPLWVVVGVFMVGSQLIHLVVLRDLSGGTVAHLAGAIWGAGVHFRLRATGGRVGPGLWERFRRRRKNTTVVREAEQADRVRERVDALLAKIHDEGIGALTEEEKDFLQQASTSFGRR